MTIEITPPTQPIATLAENLGYLDLSSSSESSSLILTPRTSGNSSITLTPGSPSSPIPPQYLSVGPLTEPELVTSHDKTKARNEKLFGLHNIKDVCYITVCLQLLWQISNIRDALIDDKAINVSGVLLAIKNLFTNIDNNTKNTLKDEWNIEDTKYGDLDRKVKDVVIPNDNYEEAYTFDTWPFFIEISKIVPIVKNNINYLENQDKSDASEIMNFIYNELQDIGSVKHLIYHNPIDEIILYDDETIQGTIGTMNIVNLQATNTYIVFKITNTNINLELTNTLSPEINVNSITYKLKGCVVYDNTPKYEHYVYYRYNNDGTTPEFLLNDSSVKQYNSKLSDKTTLQYINKYAIIVLYERTP